MSAPATSTRAFRALLVAQFFGGVNDNLLKVLISLFAVNDMMSGAGGMGEVILTGVCFVLPFILFSPLAGSFADRYSKSIVIRASKAFELVVAIAAAVFWMQASYWGLLGCLFFIGVHSALLSPSKYGILAELLGEEDLSRGNGYLEMITFVACIVGTALGGFLQAMFERGAAVPGVILVLVALVGFIASLLISRTPPMASGRALAWNPLEVWPTFRTVRAKKGLWLAMLGIAYLWSLAALYQLNLQLYAKSLHQLSDLKTALLLTVLGVGIGAGSVVAGRVSEGKVELGLVPVGAGGIALWSMVLSMHLPYALTLVVLLLLGLSSGFFIVPLNAYYQLESPEAERGTFIGASNVATYIGMLAAYALLYLTGTVLGMNPAQLFLVCGIFTIGLAVYLCRLMPEMLIRCLNWVLTHTLYRIRIVGAENIPKTGGALIICNHVAYVDPPIILASTKRHVRFVMLRAIYDSPLIKPVVRTLRAIPVSSEEGPKKLLRSLEEAKEAIRNGELVCIFAEGELSRIGHLLGFRRGFEQIMKGLDAPVIPAFIDQIWGSIFSFRNGKFFWKMPKEIPYPVTLAFGEPLPSRVDAQTVRQRIQELSADLSIVRKERSQSLQSAFLRSAKRAMHRSCLVDSSGKRLSYFGTLVASLCLRERLRESLGPNKMVGVILPPSVAGALTNVALAFDQRVPVNLNFTASADSLSHALEKCEIEDIITSRAFLEKLEMPERPGMIFAEDLFKEFSFGKKAKWGALATLLPSTIFFRVVMRDRTRRSDLATVIFSSGSTAEPKGVMLSHGNIASNIESLNDIFDLNERDGVLGVLPLFHSFGFTATLWLPLLCGIRVAFHTSPMEAGTIGELVEKERLTLLMTTPTFLLGYIRKCTPENFRSLRYVITGAEKLKERIATSFKEKFGVMPMEGYGATELSPVAMMNVPDLRTTSIAQPGHKPGTVGHPLPGVAVRIVDPDTNALRPFGEEGLLLVRGPNVMLGYLGNSEKTAEVIRDGWYVTGDMAKVDDDGFVTITDRISRFSKIAGEMVPHVKIEEAIHKVLGETETVCVVTAISDEKKGEKLVVLATKELDSAAVVKKLGEEGIPNLWIPKKENFHRVPELPLLGTGKLDLKGIRKLAEELQSAGAE